MNNLEKVYIQDFKPNEVESNFLKIRSDIEIEPKPLETGKESFCVPFPEECSPNKLFQPPKMTLTTEQGDVDLLLIF